MAKLCHLLIIGYFFCSYAGCVSVWRKPKYKFVLPHQESEGRLTGFAILVFIYLVLNSGQKTRERLNSYTSVIERFSALLILL